MVSRRSKFEKAVETLLQPGEFLLCHILISPSRDLPTDVPRKGALTLVVTTNRVLICDGYVRFGGVRWSVNRGSVAGVDAGLRWQRSWVNKAREYIVTMHLYDDRPFRFCLFAGGGGRRQLDELCSALNVDVRITTG